jgi:PmbA protein
LSKLGDPTKVGVAAAQRTLAAIGAERLDTTKLPLIVENRAVGRLLGGLLRPLYGASVDQKRSCFENDIGKQIASKLLDVTDDPFVEHGWGSRRFDYDGITTKKRPLLAAGKLSMFYLDSYRARKLKREPTVSGPTNLVFALGKRDLDGLLKAAGKAILVTSFLGGNSNSTTGDFSHGIRGFVVEGGERSRPIAAMNIAGNHKQFWKSLVELGNDPYRTSSRLVPSLLFSKMTISGK